MSMSIILWHIRTEWLGVDRQKTSDTKVLQNTQHHIERNLMTIWNQNLIEPVLIKYIEIVCMCHDMPDISSI